MSMHTVNRTTLRIDVQALLRHVLRLTVYGFHHHMTSSQTRGSQAGTTHRVPDCLPEFACVRVCVCVSQASTNTLLCHVVGLLFTNLMLRLINRK